MRPLGVVTLALVGCAVAEIAVLVLVAGQIGVGWTMLAMLATSLLGSWLLRREGVRAWRRFRAAAAAGGPPGREVSHGLLGLLSALLLALPGFLTDAVGLLLMAPPVRTGGVRLIERWAEHRLPSAAAGDLFGPRKVRVRRGPASPPGSPAAAPSSVVGGEVVEGEVVD
jgi:UPF0716 protein FxsA